MPELGTFNVHAALLPQYRGAAPINWAIINGETTTGVTTFFLDHDIDTGRIIMKRSFDIPDDADVEYVYDGLMHLGAEVCLSTIEAILEADGRPATISQGDVDAGQLRPAPKIFKDTCRIDWSLSAKHVYDFVRGLSPVPGAWTTLAVDGGKPLTLKIYKARRTDRQSPGAGSISVDGRSMYIGTSDELLEIVELQLEGKKRMAAADFLNGMKDKLLASRIE
jgi:methionyl-tRNA formyltransferase